MFCCPYEKKIADLYLCGWYVARKPGVGLLFSYIAINLHLSALHCSPTKHMNLWFTGRLSSGGALLCAASVAASLLPSSWGLYSCSGAPTWPLRGQTNTQQSRLQFKMWLMSQARFKPRPRNLYRCHRETTFYHMAASLQTGDVQVRIHNHCQKYTCGNHTVLRTALNNPLQSTKSNKNRILSDVWYLFDVFMRCYNYLKIKLELLDIIKISLCLHIDNKDLLNLIKARQLIGEVSGGLIKEVAAVMWQACATDSMSVGDWTLSCTPMCWSHLNKSHHIKWFHWLRINTHTHTCIQEPYLLLKIKWYLTV